MGQIVWIDANGVEVNAECGLNLLAVQAGEDTNQNYEK